MNLKSEKVRIEKGSTAIVAGGAFMITLTGISINGAKITLGAVGSPNQYAEINLGEFIQYDAGEAGTYEIRLLTINLAYEEAGEFLITKIR
ncbi:hypothetical protein H5T87_07910 [bacterium]|nr:hypothetical protein [bacterium]